MLQFNYKTQWSYYEFWNQTSLVQVLPILVYTTVALDKLLFSSKKGVLVNTCLFKFFLVNFFNYYLQRYLCLKSLSLYQSWCKAKSLASQAALQLGYSYMVKSSHSDLTTEDFDSKKQGQWRIILGLGGISLVKKVHFLRPQRQKGQW